jgi:hypothetical protein
MSGALIVTVLFVAGLVLIIGTQSVLRSHEQPSVSGPAGIALAILRASLGEPVGVAKPATLSDEAHVQPH